MKTNALRRNATTWLLVGTAAALASYVLLVDRSAPTTAETQARKQSLLPLFRGKQVNRIDLDVDGKHAILRIKKKGPSGPQRRAGEDTDSHHADHWQITINGTTMPADDEAVADLMRGLDGARRIRQVSSGVDSKSTGLDKPRATIVLHMGTSTYRVSLGHEAPAPAGAIYARVNDGTPAVIGRKYVSSIAKRIEAYRSRRLLPLLMEDVAELSIHDRQGGRFLTRTKWGFRLGDKGPRVSSTIVERITEAMANMNAKAFLTRDEAKRALSSDKDPVTLSLSPITKAGPGVRVRFGGKCPHKQLEAGGARERIVALRTTPSPLAACVDASVVVPLRLPPAVLVDPHPLAARPSEIEHVLAKQGDRVLEIARKGHGWHEQRPSDRNLTSDEGDSYVKALLQLEGAWVSKPPAVDLGWSHPLGSVEIQLAAPNGRPHPKQRLVVGAVIDDELWVKREQDGAILKLPKRAARLLSATAVLVRAPQLMNTAAVHIRSVQVAVGGHKRQVVERNHGNYKLVFPPGYDVDAALAVNMYQAVAELRTIRWVADKDDGSFGLGKPYATVSFKLDDGGHVKSKRLVIGALGRDGRYARWEPDTGVFVLDSRVVKQFVGYAIDRAPLTVDPSMTSGIELHGNGEQITIKTRGDTWTAKDSHGKDVGQETLDRVQEALLGMSAEGVVHIGKASAEEGFDAPVMDVTVHPRPGSAGREVVWHIGRTDEWGKMSIVYARRDGINATFAVARSKVEPLMGALSLQQEK